MSRPWRVIARKEFRSIFQERTILLAIVIQVFVAGFSSFLVVGLAGLVDPDALPSRLAPEVAVNDSLGGARFFAEEGIRLRPFSTNEEALDDLAAGRADAAILVEDPGGETRPLRLRLLLPDGELRTTITIVQVKRALESYERDLRAQREHRLEFEPVYVDTQAKAGSYAFVYSILVPLLVFLPVILAGALVADTMTEEMQRGTLPLLLVSPATPGDVVAGKLAANVAFAPLLAAAWFALLALNGLHAPLAGIAGILVLTTALASIMAALAAGIAMATKDRNKAHILYATTLFFLLGLSLALPTNPVNAVALLAAGSATPGAWLLVAASGALAVASLAALAWILRVRLPAAAAA
ncbi:MAG TPA: ABC transporter permease subunit [Candidatus Thermoplasmatota archaeon]|nr:ABC transporter permease subunit [Candidatus Thermoplasmatota archaeon]